MSVKVRRHTKYCLLSYYQQFYNNTFIYENGTLGLMINLLASLSGGIKQIYK